MRKIRITEEQKQKIIKENIEKNPSMFYIIPNLDNPLYWRMLNDKDALNEGLIQTYPFETTFKYIKNLFGLKPGQIRVIDSAKMPNGDDSKRFGMTVENDELLIASINRAFNLCGYIQSAERQYKDKKYLIFIPKYTGEITEEVKQSEGLIHISPVYNKDKILKNELTPRLKNSVFIHDGRVYFFPNKKGMYTEILSQMENFENHLKNKTNNQIWTVFLISVKDLENVKFYHDPNYLFGIYTYDNIPPSAIIKNTDIDLKKGFF